MAVIVNLNFLIVPLIMWQGFYADACPPRCVSNGGACTFTNAQRCCSPICLEQYGICGKVCLPADSPCNIDNDCCVPLACNTNTKMCGKQCLNANSPCNIDSDCCNPLACDTNTKMCEKPCLPLYSKCTLGSECCSQQCGGSSGTCCADRDVLCNSDPDCCSGVCKHYTPTLFLCL